MIARIFYKLKKVLEKYEFWLDEILNEIKKKCLTSSYKSLFI